MRKDLHLRESLWGVGTRGGPPPRLMWRGLEGEGEGAGGVGPGAGPPPRAGVGGAGGGGGERGQNRLALALCAISSHYRAWSSGLWPSCLPEAAGQAWL